MGLGGTIYQGSSSAPLGPQKLVRAYFGRVDVMRMKPIYDLCNTRYVTCILIYPVVNQHPKQSTV